MFDSKKGIGKTSSDRERQRRGEREVGYRLPMSKYPLPSDLSSSAPSFDDNPPFMEDIRNTMVLHEWVSGNNFFRLIH
jgi:hypothetical protein